MTDTNDPASFTQDDINLVFGFIRARTYDRAGHALPSSLFVGLMRRWARENNHAARPKNQAIAGLLRRAGYSTVGNERVWVVQGLNLRAKHDVG